MDQNRFQEAQAAYDAGDFRTAAKQFLASAAGGRRATAPPTTWRATRSCACVASRTRSPSTGTRCATRLYDRRGAVQANLGAAYVALGEYAQAANAYEAALDEPDYTTPYKALQGLAVRSSSAARSRRPPSPTARPPSMRATPIPGGARQPRSVLHGLGRPADAVEAYKAALGFEEYKGRGKALSNLGQAYAVLGEYADAVKAFEKATQLHGYKLTADCRCGLRDARAAQSRGRPGDRSTAGRRAQMASGRPANGACRRVDAADRRARQMRRRGGRGASHSASGTRLPSPTSSASPRTRCACAIAKRDAPPRSADSHGAGIRALIVVAVAALLLGAVIGGGYALGFGWPTQKAMVVGHADRTRLRRRDREVLGGGRQRGRRPRDGEGSAAADVHDRWRAALGRRASMVLVTVTPKSGAPLHYRVTLAREGVGWKVTGIENDWRSTGGGS